MITPLVRNRWVIEALSVSRGINSTQLRSRMVEAGSRVVSKREDWLWRTMRSIMVFRGVLLPLARFWNRVLASPVGQDGILRVVITISCTRSPLVGVDKGLIKANPRDQCLDMPYFSGGTVLNGQLMTVPFFIESGTY